ncbi:MAG: HNH endonuclease, partial [Stellaceae bacterium]
AGSCQGWTANQATCQHCLRASLTGPDTHGRARRGWGGSSSYKNVAIHRVGKSLWAKIRKELLAERGQVCEVCGFEARETRLIDAHERFRYIGDCCVVLDGIQLLCKKCHSCVHISGYKFSSDEQYEAAVAHYCTINGIERDTFDHDFDEAFTRMKKLEELFAHDARAVKAADWPGMVVDYGLYEERVRKVRERRLTPEQRAAVRDLFVHEAPVEYDTADEPIGGGTWYREDPLEVRGREIATFGAAVKWLQSLPPEEREAALKEMQDEAELADDIDGEFLPDHECPWATAMWRDTFDRE